MTMTPSRPAPPAPSPLPAALPAALWAVCAGLVAVGLPVLVLWAADARSGAGTADAVRAAAQVWLVAHGTPVRLQGGELGLVPLGLLLLPLALLHRAGRSAAREHRPTTLPAAAQLVAALAGPYSLLAAVVAGAVASSSARPDPVAALVCTGTVAALGAGAGVLRESGLRLRLPRLVRPAAAAVLALLGAGALLAGTGLVLRLGVAVDLAQATAPGLVGGAGLLLLGLALVPVAVVWGLAWLAGPGFAVGSGTAVGPFAHDLGAVPAVPLLAALPAGAPPAWVGALVLLVPVLAGALAGLLLSRSGGSLRDALLCGPLAGAAVALLCLAAGGSVGDGRLAEVGPSPLAVGLAVTGQVAAGAVAARWWAGRRAATG